MKLNKTLLIAATFALCGQLIAEVPKVSNIRASQRDGTKLVDILYDVEDAENDKLTIRVEISADGGNRYNIPARAFEGAVGSSIDPGKNKKITWNAGIDWDGEFSDKMQVRITASDGKGLPGLEWSKEIPPGGFLMGRDGGPEGSGPAVHLNINYSYWLSKFYINTKQYCEFLNLAVAANKITSGGFIKSDWTYKDPFGHSVMKFNDDESIRWNLNKFELLKNGEKPVRVTPAGAMAFANFYGYDLPTESEWEKAARGPDFDDVGEHKITPTEITDPSGLYKVNEYGISDIFSPSYEFTRTEIGTLYPVSLVKKPNFIHLNPNSTSVNLHLVRGFPAINGRENSYNDRYYFRLVRRD